MYTMRKRQLETLVDKPVTIAQTAGTLGQEEGRFYIETKAERYYLQQDDVINFQEPASWTRSGFRAATRMVDLTDQLPVRRIYRLELIPPHEKAEPTDYMGDAETVYKFLKDQLPEETRRQLAKLIESE